MASNLERVNLKDECPDDRIFPLSLRKLVLNLKQPWQVEPEDEQMMGHLFIVARKIAEDLGVNESGYRLIVNVGKNGCQEVPHIHMHLLAGGYLGGFGFPNDKI